MRKAFASRGYAVFQPNYRGTLGYGEAFRRAADGQYGRKMQTDISDGVAALARANLPRLETLALTNNQVSDAGMLALCESASLPRLRQVIDGLSGVSAATSRAVRKRFPG